MQAAKDWFEVRLDDLEMKYLRNMSKSLGECWQAKTLVKAQWQGPPTQQNVY